MLCIVWRYRVFRLPESIEIAGVCSAVVVYREPCIPYTATISMLSSFKMSKFLVPEVRAIPECFEACKITEAKLNTCSYNL